jgi:hypothetical protein
VTTPPADEVYAFAVTIAAGTQQTSPQVTSIPIPPRTVNAVEAVVPPGCSGLVGFRLGMVGQQIIPINSGGWIISDDDKITWPVQGLPESGAWQLIGYNTDIYDHTIQVRFLTSLIITKPADVTSQHAQATTAAVLAMGAP